MASVELGGGVGEVQVSGNLGLAVIPQMEWLALPTQHELQVENPRPLVLQLRHRIVHTLSPGLNNGQIKKNRKI